jgi:hypothetical protein
LRPFAAAVTPVPQQLIDRHMAQPAGLDHPGHGKPDGHNAAPKIRAWLALSEKLAKKKDLIEESLEIITMWLRDVLVFEHDPKRVLNQDRLDTLSADRKPGQPGTVAPTNRRRRSRPGGAAIQYERKIDIGRHGPANGRGLHLNIRDTMEKKVGIRFKTGGKIYDFSCGAFVLNLG